MVPTLLYTILRRIAFEAITFSTAHACFIDVYVCSGKILFYYLQNFILLTCSGKPKVDIMIESTETVHWLDRRFFLVLQGSATSPMISARPLAPKS